MSARSQEFHNTLKRNTKVDYLNEKSKYFLYNTYGRKTLAAVAIII